MHQSSLSFHPDHSTRSLFGQCEDCLGGLPWSHYGLGEPAEGGKPISAIPETRTVLNLWVGTRAEVSGKVTPEKDIDSQQEDSIQVADSSPERWLLDAGQLLLERCFLCWTQ